MNKAPLKLIVSETFETVETAGNERLRILLLTDTEVLKNLIEQAERYGNTHLGINLGADSDTGIQDIIIDVIKPGGSKKGTYYWGEMTNPKVRVIHATTI
jgi:hypothetical protein